MRNVGPILKTDMSPRLKNFTAKGYCSEAELRIAGSWDFFDCVESLVLARKRFPKRFEYHIAEC